MNIDRRSFLCTAAGGFSAWASPLTAYAASRPTRRMVASWYGEEFAGRAMANGEPFDPSDATIAAHRQLRFGTRLALRNRANGRTHEVVVQDRGPFVEDRDIDLSHAAAKALDFLEEGTATLSATIIT